MDIKFQHQVPMPLPYDLKPQEIMLDPASHEDCSMAEQMGRLAMDAVWDDETAMDNIFLAYSILRFHGCGTPGQCMSTAMVWWFG